MLAESCYEIVEVPASPRPVLSSVDATFVLTMVSTDRVPDMARITRLTPRTFIQYNRGFRSCAKMNVTHSGQDIIHAYQNVANHVLRKTDFAKVLILEDDAIIDDDVFQHLPHVDEFVRTNEFELYSLGSLGVMIPHGGRMHRRIVGPMGSAVGVIYDRSALTQIHNAPSGLDHIDEHILSKCSRKYTYYIPLITQTFPDTENSKVWGSGLNFGHLRFLGLRTSPQPGWDILYLVAGPVWWWLVVVLCAVALVRWAAAA